MKVKVKVNSKGVNKFLVYYEIYFNFIKQSNTNNI